MEKPRLTLSVFGFQLFFVLGFLSLSANKMSTSTSTSTRPTKEIDLQESQIVINKAHQLPLHVLAFKDAFAEATQDIARIAENANPEDPELLNVEIAAIKVRCAAHSGFVCSNVLLVSRVLRVARVQMPIKCVGRA